MTVDNVTNIYEYVLFAIKHNNKKTCDLNILSDIINNIVKNNLIFFH